MDNENTKECQALLDRVLETFPVFRNNSLIPPEMLTDCTSSAGCSTYIPGYNYRVPDEEGYAVPPKSLVLGTSMVHLYLTSGINPNGITGPEDIGRTWSIIIDIKASVRRYRHKRFEEESLYRRYMYGRSVDDTIKQLKEAFAEMPPSLKEKFDAAGGKNVLP